MTPQIGQTVLYEHGEGHVPADQGVGLMPAIVQSVFFGGRVRLIVFGPSLTFYKDLVPQGAGPGTWMGQPETTSPEKPRPLIGGTVDVTTEVRVKKTPEQPSDAPERAPDASAAMRKPPDSEWMGWAVWGGAKRA
jgi:hypothetical protein